MFCFKAYFCVIKISIFPGIIKTLRNLGRCGLLSVSMRLEEKGLGGGKDWGRLGCALLSPNPVPLSSLPLPAQRCRQGHLSAK